MTFTTKKNRRKLDITVSFGGDICAMFWLGTDADLFAKEASAKHQGAEYTVNDPVMGEIVYLNGEWKSFDVAKKGGE